MAIEFTDGEKLRKNILEFRNSKVTPYLKILISKYISVTEDTVRLQNGKKDMFGKKLIMFGELL